MTTMTPQELLNRAADHIEQYGLLRGKWIPDEFTDGTTRATARECPACVGGAMALEVSGGSEFSPNFIVRQSEKRTFQAALELLAPLLPEDVRGHPGTSLDRVIEWNDTTDQDEVVATLRAAAAG